MDYHNYKITSTGVSGSINLQDLGLEPLIHPIVELDLLDIGINIDDLEDSNDLYNALKNNVISAVFDDFNAGGTFITSANVDYSSVFDDPPSVPAITLVEANSAEWNSAHSTVQTNSGDWALSGTVSGNNFIQNGVVSGETLTIPEDYHMIVRNDFFIDGDLIVDGDLITI